MNTTERSIIEIIPDLKWLWAETKGDPNIRVAIIDGQVNKNHSSLRTADLEMLEIFSGFSNNRKGISSQHGTHVASIIFGQHDSQVKGIAPHCKGLVLPVFFDDENGNVTPCSQLDLVRAIHQAADSGAHIINISGGEMSDSGEAHPLLSKAIKHCEERNIMIVTAAGNNGCACLHIPGAMPSVLVVGGMDDKGIPLAFSNWGAAYRIQGILAQAENILGAINDNETALRTGTSFATAIVSGIAALLLSSQKKQGKKIDPTKVRRALLDSADGCTDWQSIICQRLLKGRINIEKAYSTIHSNKIQIMEQLHPNQDQATFPEPQPIQQASTPPAPRVVPSGIQAEGHSVTMASVPPHATTKSTPKQSGITPSCGGDESCSCNNKNANQPAQMVYALGTLGYDLVSEARRDSIAQHIKEGNPNDSSSLLDYLKKNPWDAASVTWTLNLNATPIYAVMPHGSYAAAGYHRLQDFLIEQLTAGADRISVPGIIAGQTRLMSGQIVPVIVPELRCMYNWNVAALLNAVLGGSDSKVKAQQQNEQQKSAVANFLERIYYELQNLGTSPQERAINYAATNALNAANIFSETLKDNMQLDTIEVERSAVCRMGSDCWDVKLTFFDPEKQLVRARKAYRLTIDVSDVCPVMVGAVRSWFVR